MQLISGVIIGFIAGFLYRQITLKTLLNSTYGKFTNEMHKQYNKCLEKRNK